MMADHVVDRAGPLVLLLTSIFGVYTLFFLYESDME